MKRFLFLLVVLPIPAATLQPQWQIADERLMAYFERQTRELSEKCLAEVATREDWNERAPQMREQLADMFGLAPMPPRTELKATVTKRFEHDTFTVENLHFQSMPGLYVTANLYLPKNFIRPAPTILYVCGHGPVITNGISYGNKVAYQHHGAWFARNGYVCLLIDTLQLGEIQGLHHGTHREGLWWWNSRGYSPAGVEAWNSVRALDYLSTRPEVDTNRFGITGRSGGGAYSWFAAALDDRIKAVAPVAGITDLENHVVDGAAEGHCDCMFFVNTYRWDYPQLAALVAPRPLLLCNTDSDSIFPLDGVVRTHGKVRRIYDLLGAKEKLGLVITPGPHKDTQELQLPVMRWFNRHLKGEEAVVETAATKLFSPQQLRVLEKLPADAVNTNLHFTFVKAARATVPAARDNWTRQRQAWVLALREKSFAAWPRNMAPASLAQTAGDTSGNRSRQYFQAESEPDQKVRLVFDVLSGQPAEKLTLRIRKMLGDADFQAGQVMGQLEPRSAGEKVYSEERKLTQIRRRHMLLGTTVEAMRVWDIVRGIEAIRASKKFGGLPLRIEAQGGAAVNALYASLFAPVDELVLADLPPSHMSANAPDYLNVLRIMDIPQALAMASERTVVEIRGGSPSDWSYADETARKLGWSKNLRIIAAGAAP